METKEVLIELKADTSQALDNLRKLKARNEEVKQSIKANQKQIDETKQHLEDATSEEIAQMNRLIDENEKYRAELKKNNQAINDNTKVVELAYEYERNANDKRQKSLRELRKEAAALTAQYESMSGADRVGAVGQRVAAQLKQVNEQIRSTTFAVGNFKDNIGNYVSALQGIPGPVGQIGQGLGLLQNGMGGLNKSMKALMANPILLALGALITLLIKAADAIKSNEEYSNRLSVAFSSLDPIIDMISNAFDKLAGYLVTIAEFFGDIVNQIAGTTEEAQKAVQQAQELKKAEQELVKQQRQFIVDSAKADAEVAELRAKAADKEKLTNQQRLEALDKAIAIETAQAVKRKKFAEERLRLLQLEADRTANDAKANQELAEAEAAVYRETQALNNKVRELNGQRMEAIKAIKDEEKTIQQVFTQVARNEQQRRVEAAKRLLEEMQKAGREFDAIEEQAALLRLEREFALETEYAQKAADVEANKVYTEEAKNALIADLHADLNAKLLTLDDEYYNAITAARDREEEKEAERLKAEAELVKKTADDEAKAKAEAEKRYQAQRKAILSAGAKFSGTISDELAKQSRVAFEAKKAGDIANAVTSTYEAATGAYSALASIPVVGPALGAAAAAAAVASGMLNIKAIASTKFGDSNVSASTATAAGTQASTAATAEGTSQYNTGNPTSLATIAAINRPSTSFEQGSQVSNIIEGVSEAIRNMPAPTVSVEEFESVQNNLHAKIREAN